MSNYYVTNRSIPRGFIGLTMVLEPGDNDVDAEKFHIMSRNCPKVDNHRNSGQLTVIGNNGDGTAKVRLEGRTDLGFARPTTTYKCYKYAFDADETKKITQEEFGELSANSYFQSLRGDAVQVRGTDAEASSSEAAAGALISGE